jgi:uncharacterized hydrophobic protein (TIGR00271 family)
MEDKNQDTDLEGIDGQEKKVDYDPTKIEVDKEQIKEIPRSLFKFLKDLLSIDAEVNSKKAIRFIKSDIDFSGSSIWILICSIVVASLGLNYNSIPVIIGAMLISPLMGPIRGIGMALGTNDFKILIKSLVSFGVMVGVSVLASYLFFLATPLKAETSELLGRTKPHVFDILIAFFGGLAGIIAAVTNNKNSAMTIVPGVAIATALMPPICTVGYGIAIANWSYFIGAFYLFLLNSVFICLATFMVIRLLKFPMVQFVNPRTERKVKIYVFVVLLLIVIPSVIKFTTIIKESLFQQSAEEYIQKVVEIDNEVEVVKKEFNYNDGSPEIEIQVSGKYINKENQNSWKLQLKNFDLGHVSLKVVNLSSKEIDKSEILNEILKDNNLKFSSVTEERDLYKNKLSTIAERSIELEELEKRVYSHFPELNRFIYGESYEMNQENKRDTVYNFMIEWVSGFEPAEELKMKEKLRQFLNLEVNMIRNSDSSSVIVLDL